MLSISRCINGILAAMVEEDMVHIVYIHNHNYYDNNQNILQDVYVFSSYMHQRLQVSINFGYKSALSRKVCYTMKS